MQRRGFTLVEMLVVLALTVFLMSIISTAFVTGLEAFRRLKGISEMDRDLTQAGNQLRRDLRAAHFEGDVRLSELAPGEKPPQGFFHYSESDPDPLQRQVVYESNPPSPAGTARYVNDQLQFTVRLSGNQPTDFFQAKLGQNSALAPLLGQAGHYNGRFQSAETFVYASQWAMVSYWLGSSAGPGVPLTEDAGASELAQDPVFATYPGGYPPRVQLYNLYSRRQLLVPDYFTTPDRGLVDRPSPAADDPNSDVSVFPGSPGPPAMPPEFNSAVDIRDPARRSPIAPLLPPRLGEDILIPNVLSFDVKYWSDSAGDFVDLPAGSLIYDTAIHGGPPAGSFRALQIKIRVYHPKTQQTREITLIVDL